ncbi:hypothetical protein N7474_003026 [Penicillium riverlandense]|uniref:uncharacterized protein n=1 Tax=Penicillium riverlandense TaxID=1903569 RepID=UPI0025499B04|nr:uncharacterized protein N7474_003026 [Penicillium riverlandense]KAJ5825888.1 hypothetical protein N7474_003026 [Penicillium riverlandense]
MVPYKAAVLMLLPLLQGSSASNPIQGPITGDTTKCETSIHPHVTAIHADIVAPSGSTAVVEFVSITSGKGSTTKASTSTPSTTCSSTRCPVTLIPVSFHPTISTYIQHLTTTFTVPASSTPFLAFHSIKQSEEVHPADIKPKVWDAPGEMTRIGHATKDHPVQTHPANGALSPSHSRLKGTSGGHQQVHPPAKSSPVQQPEVGASPSVSHSKLKDTSGVHPQITPPAKPSPAQQPNVWASASFDLQNAPDAAEMSTMLATMSGPSSEAIAEILSKISTETSTMAFAALQSELSSIPTSSTTGAAAIATNGFVLAGYMGDLINKGRRSDHNDKELESMMDESGGRIRTYIENRKSEDNSGGGSSEGSSCTSGGGLLSLLKSASCFVNDLGKGISEAKVGPPSFLENTIDSAWDWVDNDKVDKPEPTTASLTVTTHSLSVVALHSACKAHLTANALALLLAALM